MAPIDATAGALLDGATISAMLYGVSCAQVVQYYLTFPGDSWRIKLMVATVWLMDTLQQGLLSHAAWFYASRKCASLTVPGCEYWAWSVLGEAIPSIIAISIVEGFYIMRIWHFGNRKSAMILILPAFIAPTFLFVNFANPSFFVGGEHFTIAEWFTCIAAASYAVTDIGIASMLCYYLYTSRHLVSATSKSMINNLINYAIATGLLTSIIMLTYLVTFVALAGDMIFLAVYFVGTKVYVNSLLAALNNRERLRSRHEYASHVEF
ncbi:hypothetical protein GLOTRDRAFT_131800 [Gloeophyllum trabeum ATCC 11539]|uniref:DUF6534 domain-containing protein n=1 Tax=Gloeophyllum trabeum (strain ATCC 11539 / FP-39264 / Madison 617) TaxID=670483 RepID=S7PY56_GLOTA|nr:uncharacterized protein GLOTRDRAFT_131800 [Gloeophyllum trabeum ATCC 11539]EPQ52566.1 hypothetical protein GLOTRDRAFT_131800 [Gloeophyllum trabeum ATCC 11539]